MKNVSQTKVPKTKPRSETMKPSTLETGYQPGQKLLRSTQNARKESISNRMKFGENDPTWNAILIHYGFMILINMIPFLSVFLYFSISTN